MCWKVTCFLHVIKGKQTTRTAVSSRKQREWNESAIFSILFLLLVHLLLPTASCRPTVSLSKKHGYQEPTSLVFYTIYNFKNSLMMTWFQTARSWGKDYDWSSLGQVHLALAQWPDGRVIWELGSTHCYPMLGCGGAWILKEGECGQQPFTTRRGRWRVLSGRLNNRFL